MAYRNLLITSPARLSCRDGQLVVQAEQTLTFPMEDLLSVMLESRRSTITTAALAALAQSGTVVFFCDERHLPCGTLLPYAQHSRQLAVARAQLAWTQLTQKQLWQQIVIAKIRNQAECLALCGRHEEAAFLHSRARAVLSGDRNNTEAAAAAMYFPALFGAGFTRGAELDSRNGALNYGYAILRGCMARCLCAYGFLPWHGLHHCSELNQFNLADDLMEPYRPVVDLFVAANVREDAILDTRLKGALFQLLNADILSGRQHHSVAYAMERQVQSLRKPEEPLLLPQLLPTHPHVYE